MSRHSIVQKSKSNHNTNQNVVNRMAKKNFEIYINNLKLNVLKTKEIVFENSRRRADTPQPPPPPPLPGIAREKELKILGVTITRHLSASEHVRHVISDGAQSLRTPGAAASWSV